MARGKSGSGGAGAGSGDEKSAKRARTAQDAKAEAEAFLAACSKGLPTEALEMLSRYPAKALPGEWTTITDANGRDALTWTCKREHVDVARRLLVEGADANAYLYANVDFEDIPLSIAYEEKNNAALVEVLCEYGADTMDQVGGSMLCDACLEGKVEMATVMILTGSYLGDAPSPTTEQEQRVYQETFEEASMEARDRQAKRHTAALAAKDAAMVAALGNALFAKDKEIAAFVATATRMWALVDPLPEAPELKPHVTSVLADPTLLVPFELHPDRQADHVNAAQQRFEKERAVEAAAAPDPK